MEQSTAIRWDIIEEHLDEAAFLYGQWEEALRSPLYTLAEIAEGPEERMLAHLDGLVLGGAPVAKKLLLPALGSDEPAVVFAAAFGLLDGGRPEDFESLVAALEKGEPPRRAAIRRAFGVVTQPEVGQRLAALAPRAVSLQADLLEVLGYLRVDSGLRLEALANAKNPAKEGLAIRLARAFPDKLDPAAIERGLASPGESVRAAAFETGLIAGQRRAFAACEAEVAARGPAFPTAALILGLSGDEKSVVALVPELREKFAREAAFALGFSGRISAANALLEALSDEKLAPVAAEGFATITGLPVEKKFAKPPKRWNPEEGEDDAEEEYGPEADLPKPEREVIVRWWKGARPKLDPVQRWLCGQPWSVDALVSELDRGPARRRAALSLDLAIRTRGQVQIAWDALAARQRRQLKEARGAAGRSAVHSYRDVK
jgi:uncharacterized protein (TIGR02270 family)